MNKNFIVSSIIIILCVVFVRFTLNTHKIFENEYQNLKTNNIKYVNINEAQIRVDLSLTDSEQDRGLGGRNVLKDGEGMLFIFDHEARHAFWMKDMFFPIDIVWMSEDLRIVYIKKDARPESYPESFAPDQSAMYVLEIPAGFSEKNNFKVGDRVIFTY